MLRVDESHAVDVVGADLEIADRPATAVQPDPRPADRRRRAPRRPRERARGRPLQPRATEVRSSRGSGRPGELDTGERDVRQRRHRRGSGHRSREVREDRNREPGIRGVEGGRADAVVRRQADDVDVGRARGRSVGARLEVRLAQDAAL